MKILHINQSDISGGASIAGYRLHQSLINRNIDSKLLVDQQKINSDHVLTLDRKRVTEDLISRFSDSFGLNYIFVFNSFQILKQSIYKNADILNFHNLHGGYFNYLAMAKLTQSKSAVFTLHDMWSFTGHCAYSFDCQKWKTGCGQCPYPETYPKIKRDSTALEWKLKKWVYQHSNLAIVCPSQWLTEQAEQSILNCFPIHHIPNGINIQEYQPLDPDICRQVLDLPLNKKILLFGAQSLSDPRKGGDLLLKSLQNIPQSLKQDLILLTFGDGGEQFQSHIDITVLSLGYISGDRLKSIAYSAADLFLFPTRADNLPLVLQESMACGTPLISFHVGGVPELVRSGVTGELAQPENILEFTQKIIELLEDTNKREVLSKNCRHIAKMEYSIELQTDRYVQLYQQCLSRS